MNDLYKELAERIRAEISDLERVVQKLLRIWPQVQTVSAEQDVYLDSVALNLHSFYSGLERLFVLIARHVDQNLPDSETWHRDLLHQMSRELIGIRPGVIGAENAVNLDEFRQARHLVRNVYSINLAAERVVGLMLALPGLWNKVQVELLAFADFLEELAKA